MRDDEIAAHIATLEANSNLRVTDAKAFRGAFARLVAAVDMGDEGNDEEMPGDKPALGLILGPEK